MPPTNKTVNNGGKSKTKQDDMGMLGHIMRATANGDFDFFGKMGQTNFFDLNRRNTPSGLEPVWGALDNRKKRALEELVRVGVGSNMGAECNGKPLFRAVLLGTEKEVKALLKKGADIQSRIFEGNTVLHFCAARGEINKAKILLEHGLDVNVRNDHDETPLHCAAQTGKTEFVRFLLANGADISATCTFPMEKGDAVDIGSNVTPLFVAAYYEQLDVVDVLIKAGADVTVKTSQNHSVLLFPAQNGPLKLVNMLLRAGAKSIVNEPSNYGGYVPLLMAAKVGQTDIVRALLEVEGIDINPLASTEETPLIMAAGSGHLEVVKLLLKRGVSINSRGFGGITPLYISLMEKKEAVARFLIGNGADVRVQDSQNGTPISVACEKNLPLDLLKTLVEKGADVNSKNRSGSRALHLVAERGYTEIVKFLVDHGADCDVRDGYGFTPLHYAVRSGFVEIVAFLAPKVKNSVKCPVVTMCCAQCHASTPLHDAVSIGHLKIVKILCRSGADINAVDNMKCTPLHNAVSDDAVEVVKFLIKSNAHLNVKEKKGRTPLFLAIKYHNEKVVRLLLDAGADVNVANNSGVLAIHAATKCKNFPVVKALLAKGAIYNAEVRAKGYSGTPLKLAQQTGDAELILTFELVSKLFSAVEENDAHQIGCAVKAGAIVNARNATGKTALHYMVSNDNVKAVKILLESGADVTITSPQGELPLHMAVRNGCVEMVRLLLASAKNLSFVKYNSAVNATTSRGATALHIAVENNRLEVVKLLLANGAVYNAKNASGRTPFEFELAGADGSIKTLLSSAEKLFEAVKKEDNLEEVERILGDDNCIVNVRDADGGGTPLYWSVSKNHANTVAALLACGANYTLVTNKGTTPLHIAASKGNVKIVKKILNKVKTDNAEKVADFVNATTTSGTAALHAASNSDIVKCLLQADAMYNLRNGAEKTALQLTQNDDVRALLQTTHELFKDVAKGVSTVMDTINGLKSEMFKAVTSTRNAEGKTLMQVALVNGRVKIGSKLAEKMKKIS